MDPTNPVKNPTSKNLHDNKALVAPNEIQMGGCQNYLNNRCRTIIRTKKGTLILTTTQMDPERTPEALRESSNRTASKKGHVHCFKFCMGLGFRA